MTTEDHDTWLDAISALLDRSSEPDPIEPAPAPSAPYIPQFPAIFFNPALNNRNSVRSECLAVAGTEEYVHEISFFALLFLRTIQRFPPLPIEAESRRPVLTAVHCAAFAEIGVQSEPGSDLIVVPGCGSTKKVSYVFSTRVVRRQQSPVEVPMTERAVLHAMCRVFQPFKIENVWERAAVAAAYFKDAVDTGLCGAGELPLMVAVEAVIVKRVISKVEETAQPLQFRRTMAAAAGKAGVAEAVTIEGATRLLDAASVMDYLATTVSRRKVRMPRILADFSIELDRVALNLNQVASGIRSLKRSADDDGGPA